MLKYLSFCFLITVFVSCKSTSFFQQEQNTSQHISIGNIGLNKDYLFDKSYTYKAIPSYKKQIKLQASLVSFNKKRHQAFLEAKRYQKSNVSITYIDSLNNKPSYVNLKIADNVSFIESLNSKANSKVKNYLETQSEATIVTQIAIALKTEDLNVISNSDAVFLIELKTKTYGLQIYENAKLIKTISLKDGVVFNYNVSNACWKTNSKYRVEIADLVNNKQKCPTKTYSSANLAKKKINYFKL